MKPSSEHRGVHTGPAPSYCKPLVASLHLKKPRVVFGYELSGWDICHLTGHRVDLTDLAG